MKKFLVLLTFTSFASFPAFSQSTYELVAGQSQIKWKGTHILGGSHEGTLTPISGSIEVSPEGSINKGSFTIDMNTLRSTDKDGGKGLDEHLKSEDFFETEKFPQAFFSIIEVKTAPGFDKSKRFTVTGFLGIKGITNQITFPALIDITGQKVIVKADIVINRTKWGIVYQSSSFFGDLKDDVIKDEMDVAIEITLRTR